MMGENDTIVCSILYKVFLDRISIKKKHKILKPTCLEITISKG